MKKKRRTFTSAFKARVALAAIKEQKTLSELSSEFDLHPNQISQWKQQFLELADTVFENGSSKKSQEENLEKEKEKLHKIIGQKEVEVDFLKKSLKKLGIE